jgi:hypothetical protein
MIIDLSEIIKTNPKIRMIDFYHEIGTGIFLDDDVSGFLFNIEIEKFTIEVFKDANVYCLIVLDSDEDSSFLEKNFIPPIDLKQEIIDCINFCQKYIKLRAFS